MTADDVVVTEHCVRARHADFVECACGQLCVNEADHDEHVFQVKVDRAQIRRRREARVQKQNTDDWEQLPERYKQRWKHDREAYLHWLRQERAKIPFGEPRSTG